MLNIRLAEPTDYKAIYNIYKPFVENTSVSFETEVPPLSEFSLRINQILVQYPWLVAEHDGVVIGYAYACKHRQRAAYRWSVETSVYIKHNHERRGIATGLYTALFEILTLQGYKTALAGITLPNEPSVNFHQSFGFSIVGVYDHIGYKSDQWHSVSWWQRAITNYDGLPKKLFPMKEINGTSPYRAALNLGIDKCKNSD